MLRSCLLMLALYAALFAGYYYWIGPQFDPPWVYVGVGVVALIVTGCIGALINARMFYRDWSLLAAAKHDGRWTAVHGELHPVHEPLTAPFSGEECVMCEYDVASQLRVPNSSGEGNPGSDFTGFLMNPTVVRTKSGDMRLLGFPNLDQFSELRCYGYHAVKNAQTYLQICKFEDYSGIKLVSILGAIVDAWQDDDGLVRKNLRLGKTQPADLFTPELLADLERLDANPPQNPADIPDDEFDDDDDFDDDLDEDDDFGDDDQPTFTARIPILKEKRVPVGVEVCAIGVYSQARGGLTPGGLGLDKFIKLMRGGLDKSLAKARGSVFSHIFGGLLVFVLVNAATYGVLMANRLHPVAVDKRKSEALQALAKDDALKLERLISRGLDVNATESNRTLLHKADDPACVRVLLAHGANVNAKSDELQTPLMLAASRGNREIVQLLLDAKADVSPVSAHQMTALDYAVRSGHVEIAELIRKVGGKEAPPAVQP